MNLTDEQLSILDFAKTSRENLLISALAGCAKTSTLERVGAALTREPILYLVFNKRNADEAVKRMPQHIVCKTFNAVGHGVWGKFVGRRLIVNTKKNYENLRTVIDELGKTEAREARESFSEILAAIRLAKITGYIPPGKFESVRRLLDNGDPFEDIPTSTMLHCLNSAITISIKQAFDGTIDFDDQIYMPTLFGGTFPQFPLVLVDETQDLSPLNHAMLRKLVGHRLICVGDPNQSIYVFRGAVQRGMEILCRDYTMHERRLSISFRCPRAIVERAKWRAPNFQAPEWAEEGEINELSDSWLPSDGAAIICRNNAPLFAAALRLIKLGRGVKLVGSDIGPNLIRTLKRLGPESMTQTQVLDAINRYETEALAKSRSPANLADKCDCLRVFAEQGSNLSATIGYAEHIFSAGGTIQLLSGHKAKGLEWETVYHLDPWRIPSKYAKGEEEIEQEKNIRYVIETRSKRVLNIGNLEDLK